LGREEREEEENARESTSGPTIAAPKCVSDGMRIKANKGSLLSALEYRNKSMEVRDVLFASSTACLSLTAVVAHKKDVR
jgi:hypothetical protein